MHFFNEDSLRECFNELDGKKACGADGIDKEKYREDLDENLRDLIARMKRMAYRPGPIRQVQIPKPGKPTEKRPLGINNFEDKIVQKMMQKVLESIYDPQFLNCSYGFRRGRGCHDAIQDLHQHLRRHEVQTVIDRPCQFLRIHRSQRTCRDIKNKDQGLHPDKIHCKDVQVRSVSRRRTYHERSGRSSRVTLQSGNCECLCALCDR